jgi:hypothetical protein
MAFASATRACRAKHARFPCRARARRLSAVRTVSADSLSASATPGTLAPTAPPRSRVLMTALTTLASSAVGACMASAGATQASPVQTARSLPCVQTTAMVRVYATRGDASASQALTATTADGRSFSASTTALRTARADTGHACARSVGEESLALSPFAALGMVGKSAAATASVTMAAACAKRGTAASTAPCSCMPVRTIAQAMGCVRKAFVLATWISPEQTAQYHGRVPLTALVAGSARTAAAIATRARAG